MKLFKKVSILVLLIVVLLAGLAALFTWIYADEIERYGVEQVNELINTQIKVEEIEFSVFKKFPLASLAFKKVSAKEVVDRKQKGELFSMQSIYLEFNIWKVIRGVYEVERISLENGEVHLHIDNNGKDNYHFWKKREGEKSAFVIGLEAVQLNNVQLTYINEIKALTLKQTFNNCALKGKFSEEKYSLETKGPVFMEEVKSGKWTVFKAQQLFIDFKIEVDHNKDSYTIRRGAFSLADLHFFLNGDFTIGNEASLMDLELAGNKLDIASLVSLFPSNIQQQMKAYKSEGEIQVKGQLRGWLSASLSPEINVAFNVRNGNVAHRPSGMTFSQIVLAGRYNNGSQKSLASSSLEIDTIEATFGSGTITGKYRLFNFNEPRLDLNAKVSQLNLEELHSFLPADTIQSMKGMLNLNLKWNGLIDDLSKMTVRDFRKGNTVGKANFSEAMIQLKDNRFRLENLNGQLDFNNNDVKVTDLSGLLMNNELKLNGYFKNLLPYLLDKNEKLLLRASLYSPALNWDDFMPESNNNGGALFRFPERLSFELDAVVDRFQFRKFKAEAFKGKMRYHNSEFVLEEAVMTAVGGSVAGSMKLDAKEYEKTGWSAKLKLKEVDITSLFNEFDNFGQEVISGKNLKGRANADIVFSGIWNQQWQVDLSSIEAHASIEINKGELIDYQAVQALSRFIKVDELNHIRFSSLKNEIEIRDQRVVIPEMQISSSALNLSLSGIHKFNNEIEYHFSLLLRDILSKKARAAKKENMEFGGYEEDDGLGRTTLFLKMTGTVDDPKISYDRKGLRKKWEENIQQEKETVKSIWKEEFGKDKPPATVGQEYNFQMEWEEEAGVEGKEIEQEETVKPNPLKVAAQKDSIRPKGKVGKWLNKISQPNEEEFE
jgi:hypothetical protein